MRAWIFAALWLGTGLLVATRGPRSPSERALCLLFWPFFLGETSPNAPAPLIRLQRALGTDPGAEALLASLERALDELRQRLKRLDAALLQLPDPGDGPLAQARQESRRLLEETRDAQRLELERALARVEQAATRLFLAQETADRGEVQRVLENLRHRLLAEEEVATR